jgi:peroxiredoxin Q/BCP
LTRFKLGFDRIRTMNPKIISSPLKVGSKAPSFTLPDQDGKDVRLYDLLKRGPVVVYFYPKAFTAVCTAESCSFRDNFEVFSQAGAQIVGISSDSVKTQLAFHKKYNLSFPVLSDKGSKVHKSFGLRNGGSFALGWALNDRVTFVIDSQGIVRHRSTGLFEANSHVEDSLAMVKSLLADDESAA